MSFEKSPKQIEAIDIMNTVDDCMLYGGSRSGKTTIAMRQILNRAMKRPSRHLVVRRTFNSVTRSIVNDTLPKVLELDFPRVCEHKDFKLLKSPHTFLTIPTYCGNTSQIWFGGTDKPEKILGNEYSTIYANECSEIEYEQILLLRTRLAENSKLPLKFFLDCNPPGKKHWTYVEFIEKLIPGTKEPSLLNTGFILMNPKDNEKNLPPDYIKKKLETLPKRERQRFLDGKFLDDIEGALWTTTMLDFARSLEPGELEEVVIAVDPAVTNNDGSDDTGIIVAGRDEWGQVVVMDDLSGKFSTQVWANRVVNAYKKYNANNVVCETNQGGDLIVDVLKNIDRSIRIIKVHAKNGKFARAEPVSGIYECDEEVYGGRRGTVCHLDYFPELEAEMTEWVPFNTKESPNRIDALVYAILHLVFDRPQERSVMVFN